MPMSVTVEVTIPDCAPKTVTLGPTLLPDTYWYAVDEEITRTCPVSGNVHTVYLNIYYTPNVVDWRLDLLLVRFGTLELGFEEYGAPPPTFIPFTGGSSIDAVAGTQMRTAGFSLFGLTPPPIRMLNSLFEVTALGMPIRRTRPFRLRNAFNYTLPAANTLVTVFEDAGGGVAGERYGSVTTDAAGECSLTSETPLRDFVLRIGSQDYLLASGSTPAEITTDSTDKTDGVVALLAGPYAPVVAPIAVT